VKYRKLAEIGQLVAYAQTQASDFSKDGEKASEF
jgi:hypothetical protein